jgi:glucose-6-phosphate-specific signal transduction histidine kinase
MPYAVVFTLLIEILSVIKIGKVSKIFKTYCVVSVANILSFGASYFIPIRNSFYMNFNSIIPAIKSIPYYMTNGPYYIVVTAYLIVTLLVEFPLVYFMLKKDSDNHKRLMISIVVSNIITTLAIAVVERTFFYGIW